MKERIFSNKMKSILIILLILLLNTENIISQSQTTNSTIFRGHITDSENDEAIEFATVKIPELSLWAISDKNGNFAIPEIKAGEYSYEVSLLGYQKLTGKVTLQKESKPIQIKLSSLSLALSEVIVTAQGQKNGSTSKIDQTAIQHLQPKSVEDLLQLLPGNITQNPDLNKVGQAYIREITGNSSNALGTAILINGAPISNDANMQALSTAKSGISLNDQSTGGRGVDLRNISPDNIESVEVIRGIPSVEYGNLTSGALVIKTKSGATPLETKVKIDPFSKMVYAGKGLILGNKQGALNLSADYSQSYADIRKKYNGFDRITANIGYSNTFLRSTSPLTFHMNLSFFSTINNEKSDPQLKKNEKIENNNSGFRWNLEGSWRLDKSWISNLSYSLMTSYTHQKDYRNEQIILQSGITPIANSSVSGEYQTVFLNSSYYSEYTVDGKPIDLYAQLKGDKLFQFSSKSFTIFRAGIEWRYNVNKGDGLVFNPLYPPSVNDIQSVRPRSFKSIPPMSTLAFFLEDKLHLALGTTALTLQGGVRMSNLFIDKSAHRSDLFTLEPRINIEYNILNKDNNNLFDNLSITGGYGVSSKAPTLLYLYPEKAYLDEPSFSLMFPNDMNKSIAIMTTKVIEDTSNPNLKPATSHKAEVGLYARIRKITGNMTFFYEKHENEFSFRGVPVTMPFRSYSVPNGIEGASYKDGMLYYEQNNMQHEATITNDTSLYTYNMPVNSTQTLKKGVEYSFNLGHIPLLKTEVVIDGGWLHIKRRSTEPYYNRITSSFEGKKYPYMAVMPGGNGSIEERINTNIRFITHIPRLRMIFSTTAQVIWKQTYQQIYQDDNGHDLFYKAADPQSPNKEEKYFINPIGFIDREGAFNTWHPEYGDVYKYRMMMTQYGHSNYFGKEDYPTTILLNFRLTKEFGKMMELSFIANNFLKISKTAKNRTSAGYKNLTIPLYFGAELLIRI